MDSCDLVRLLECICCPLGYGNGRTCCHCCDTEPQNKDEEDEESEGGPGGKSAGPPPKGYRMVRTDF